MGYDGRIEDMRVVERGYPKKDRRPNLEGNFYACILKKKCDKIPESRKT